MERGEPRLAWLAANIRNLLSAAPHLTTPLNHIIVEVEGSAAAAWLTKPAVAAFRSLVDAGDGADRMIHVALNVFGAPRCLTVIPFGSIAVRAAPTHWARVGDHVTAAAALRSASLTHALSDLSSWIVAQSTFQRSSQGRRPTAKHPIRIYRPSVFLGVIICTPDTLIEFAKRPVTMPASMRQPWSRNLIVCVLPDGTAPTQAVRSAVDAVNAIDTNAIFAILTTLESLPEVCVSLRDCLNASTAECVEALHSILNLESPDSEELITVDDKPYSKWLEAGGALPTASAGRSWTPPRHVAAFASAPAPVSASAVDLMGPSGSASWGGAPHVMSGGVLAASVPAPGLRPAKGASWSGAGAQQWGGGAGWASSG